MSSIKCDCRLYGVKTCGAVAHFCCCTKYKDCIATKHFCVCGVSGGNHTYECKSDHHICVCGEKYPLNCRSIAHICVCARVIKNEIYGLECKALDYKHKCICDVDYFNCKASHWYHKHNCICTKYGSDECKALSHTAFVAIKRAIS